MGIPINCCCCLTIKLWPHSGLLLLSYYQAMAAFWVKVPRLVVPHPLLDRFWHCSRQRQVKLHTLFRTTRPKQHTLSSGTSPYSPNKGVPLPLPRIITFITMLSHPWVRRGSGKIAWCSKRRAQTNPRKKNIVSLIVEDNDWKTDCNSHSSCMFCSCQLVKWYELNFVGEEKNEQLSLSGGRKTSQIIYFR